MVRYGVNVDVGIEELASGLRSAHSRMGLALDNLPGEKGDEGPAEVLAEVEKYLDQAALAMEALVKVELSRWPQVGIAPGLYALLEENCRLAMDRQPGQGLDYLVSGYVNAAVLCFLTSGDLQDAAEVFDDFLRMLAGISQHPLAWPADSTETLGLFNEHFSGSPESEHLLRLIKTVRARARGEQPQSQAEAATGTPATATEPASRADGDALSAGSADESRRTDTAEPAHLAPPQQNWPKLTAEIVPGVYARFMDLCTRSAAPELGLTAEKLAGIMVNTAISGFFSTTPDPKERCDVGEEVKVFHELVGEYGQARQSEPAGDATAKPAQSKPAKPGKTAKTRRTERSVRKVRKQAGR